MDMDMNMDMDLHSGDGYGYALHGIFTGEFCDEGTKGLSNWKAIEGRVGSL